MILFAPIPERTSAVYTCTLREAATGVVVPLASLTTLTVSLFDATTAGIINSRTAQSVLNANQGTYHATSGLFTWAMIPADNVIVGTAGDEVHVAEFHAIWNTAANALSWRITFTVTSFVKQT